MSLIQVSTFVFTISSYVGLSTTTTTKSPLTLNKHTCLEPEPEGLTNNTEGLGGKPGKVKWKSWVAIRFKVLIMVVSVTSIDGLLKKKSVNEEVKSFVEYAKEGMWLDLSLYFSLSFLSRSISHQPTNILLAGHFPSGGTMKAHRISSQPEAFTSPSHVASMEGNTLEQLLSACTFRFVVATITCSSLF